MSKRKWYTRAIYSMVALAMTVGLLIVPAAGAAPVAPEAESAATKAALPADAEISSICFVLGGTADGSVAWSDDYAGTGDYSVALDGGSQDGSTYAAVVWDLDGTMDFTDISSFDYSYYFEAAGTYGPHVCFYTHDTVDDQTGEITLEPSTLPCPAAAGWNDMAITPATGSFFWYGTEAGTAIATGPGTLNTLATFQADAGFADHVIDRIQIEFGWWSAGTTGVTYLDDVVLEGEDIGLEVSLCPDIAYNVKTAEEEYRLYGFGDCETGIPMCDTSPDLKDWRVFQGCGAGDVEIVDGGGLDTTNNYIALNLVTKGDCNITVDFDDDPSISFNAEKKWGEIYCTELVSEDTILDEYLVTETVEASFLWEDCVTETELPADDAVIGWWLMDIDALADVAALEAALGDDPCDDDGGCGTYEEYDPAAFTYDSTVYKNPFAVLNAIQGDYSVVLTDSYIFESNGVAIVHTDYTQNQTDVDGEATVEIHMASPTGVVLVTLADYPIDKHGQNVVCVQHETWIVIPPPEIEKLPNICWAGEKDVVEWRLPADAEGMYVIWYLESPSVGTFEGSELWFSPPMPGGIAAVKETAITEVVVEVCDGCGEYGVARVVLHSDKQGKSNVVAALVTGVPEVVQDATAKQIPAIGIVDQQGFLVYFLAFEEIVLVNLDEDVDNDEAWLEDGEVMSELPVDDEGLLRVRVKGYFEDPVLQSIRAEALMDTDGDGVPDIVLPAGRWVLPDDYPTLADGALWKYSKPHWDIMDTPIDDIVSWLDEDGDQIETVGGEWDDEVTWGGYGDEACFEAPIDDGTITAADLTAYWADAVDVGPVIGPFSKLEPTTQTGWDIDAEPCVPADGNEVDEWDEWIYCRTTVVPDGKLTAEDAVMPPAEIFLVVTEGDGLLRAVNKADLYYRDEDCVFGTLGVDGEVFTNPYYWQEIPANLMIPPNYGSGPAGYEWDSWAWEGDDTIDGPYRFWDSLSVWGSDVAFARDLAGLPATEDPEVLKVYTDNRGEAWAEFEQKSFDSSTIKAVAGYPYLIGDHPAVVSNPVVKTSEDMKDIVVYVDEFVTDPIRKMLYVFVRNYDGTPAECEKVDWVIDGPWGIFEELLTGTCGPCTNSCYPVDYYDCEDCYIDTDGRSAINCTREMTAAEITTFAADVSEFLGDEEVAEDYAVTGIKVLSSHLEDVDVSIKIYDCWEGEIIVKSEDKMVEFTENEPTVDVGLASIMDNLVMVYTYKAGEGVDGWTVYNPDWAVTHPEWNTLTTLLQGRGYWLEVDMACTLTYETQSYPLDAGWNMIGWLGA